MSRMRMKDIRALDEKALRARLQESRSDMGKKLAEAAKGTIRKKSGSIRPLRRDIARMMTRMSEIRIAEEAAGKGGSRRGGGRAGAASRRGASA